MNRPLRVLNVEDSEDDALLVQLTLEGGGYDPTLKRVDTPEAMSAALDEDGWDVIISDYIMPHFSGMEALKLARLKAKDIPFIVVSGKIGEDVAVDAMKAGANDYVLKMNLSRLVPAIKRELVEAEVRAARRRAETALVESETKFRVLVEDSQVGVYIIQEGVLTYVNPKLALMFGYSVAEMTSGMDVLDLVAPEHKQPSIEKMARVLSGEDKTQFYALKACRKGGEVIDIELFGSKTVYSGKPAIIGTLLDVTERTSAAEALRVEVEVTSALLEASAVTSACLDWDKLTGKLLDLVHGIISSEDCAIVMLEDGMLVPQKAVGHSEGFLAAFSSAGEPLKGSGPPELVHTAKKTLSFRRDETSRLATPRISESLGLMEIIISPIMARDMVVGFLCANFRELSTDLRVTAIMEGIAGQLGVAYENTRLYDETQKKTIELARKVETLKALSEIDLAILSTLKQDAMLSKAMKQVRRVVPADFSCIIFRDHESGKFYCKYHWGWDGAMDMTVPEDSFPGLPAVASGATLSRMALEAEAGPSEVDSELVEAGVRSDVFIPIVSKEKGVGLLYLGSRRVAGFSIEDIQTAERLANQIGIALENTRLVSDLENMVMNVVIAFSSAIDAKSPWTKGHSERVTNYAVEIAEMMGLSNDDIETLRLGGLLHDIGKIGTYDVILDKPGKLTEEEFALIKLHPDRGCEILEPIKQFKDILPIVRHHHERMDGKGYPSGLKGEEIPLLARIVCVADSFDSMTADRPYRPSPGIEFAIGEFRRCYGTQFDPNVLDIFLDILEMKREKKAA